jgi:hypothetical protein
MIIIKVTDGIYLAVSVVEASPAVVILKNSQLAAVKEAYIMNSLYIGLYNVDGCAYEMERVSSVDVPKPSSMVLVDGP